MERSGGWKLWLLEVEGKSQSQSMGTWDQHLLLKGMGMGAGQGLF